LDAQTTGKVMTDHKNYEYLNLDYIFELADGDTSFVKEIIDTFLTSTPINMSLLVQAVAQASATDIIFYAHKLKGSFNFIGSSQMSDTFTLIEAYAEHTDKHNEIEKLMAQIKATTACVYADLHHFSATLPST
jgi:HPt (histidine-containing phosphotransfer) domain-containing protein